MAAPRILEFLTYGGIGGTQRMVIEFLRRAAPDHYAMCVCVLLRHDLVNDVATQWGMENISLNMRGYWDLAAWYTLYQFIKTREIRLIRTYGLKAHMIGRIVGKLLGVPIQITSIRSTDPWRKWYHVWLDRLTSGLTTLYLANSEAGKIATHQRERIPLAKIAVIPNGVDVAYFQALHARKPELAAAYKAEFQIPPDASVLGIVATLRTMKGHVTLFDALPEILRAFPKTYCLCVGGRFVNEPWYEAELRQRLRAQGLVEHVILAGFRQDVAELLACVDIMILPSLWEGLPVSILEAMAMKIPVIATPVGGIAEVVVEHKTGLFIPPQDPPALARAAIMLLNNREMVENMGEAGYARVCTHFALDLMVARTEALYRQLLTPDRLT